MWRNAATPKHLTRVNPDELLREQGGTWESARDQLTAGKAALAAIDECLANRRSFNQETTLTGHKTLQTIKRAHTLGYHVHLLYVGVENEQVALERIAHRIEIGGHGIDEELVRRRFRTSLSNFCKALPYCDEAHVFDNTAAFKRLALWSHDTLAWWGASQTTGAWLGGAMADEELWRR